MVEFQEHQEVQHGHVGNWHTRDARAGCTCSRAVCQERAGLYLEPEFSTQL